MQTYSATTKAPYANKYNLGSIASEKYAIADSDSLFVSATQYGKTILSGLSLTGCNTLQELLSAVKKLLSGVQGIVNITVRNRTHGWSTTTSIRVARPAMSILAYA